MHRLQRKVALISGAARVTAKVWRSRTTMMPTLPMDASLHAREVPVSGDDTMFADLCLACETRSAGTRAPLHSLYAVHDDTLVTGPRTTRNARTGRR